LPAATFLYILHTHRVEWLPESGLGILAGAAFSLCVLGLTDDQHVMMDDGGPLEFDEDFFMTWLLPPIIFEAAFNLNVDAFQASLFPTLLFAFLGLLCSTTVIGTLLYTAGQVGSGFAVLPPSFTGRILRFCCRWGCATR